ncbi:hypothetical protein CROQUDRAFT_660504 [Cronartium quercuum f. sp. fusiforme G11]|uniref:Ribosomal protein bL31m N-terminal domain-containing protein n=1 Tax=Cronartium quercuum f. sp. fusiforme G11 TaxID=708437 RepID=A0A9P6NE83_9BASI|nr:hypothetical protein CROQUDRAFT_660504 [Cronartium quercuum f. sp. fusiforme G11]
MKSLPSSTWLSSSHLPISPSLRALHPRPSSSRPSGSIPPIVYPTAPIFNRREKRKLRISYPRPDRSPVALYPQTVARFPNKVTLADGSVIQMVTASPRSKLTLVKDVTNHPLWNPSLAREVADADESGRVGRFARRYRQTNQTDQTSELKQEAVGTSTEDLEWMSGESAHTFYGVGDAKNIAGQKKGTKKK